MERKIRYPKISKMNWFFKMFGITGICLAPFSIQIRDGYFTDRIINHEKMHWNQQLEVFSVVVFLCLLIEGILVLNGIFAWWFILFLVVPFAYWYAWYLIEWLIKIPFCKRKAYKSISFEQEARNYIPDNKRIFGWMKYIFSCSPV